MLMEFKTLHYVPEEDKTYLIFSNAPVDMVVLDGEWTADDLIPIVRKLRRL